MTVSGENMGVIIGRRGETLDALQYLTNLVVNRKMHERKRIILDAEGYRERRAETLEKLARRLADKVKRTGQRVFLEPMNPQERRIIHTALQNDIYVTTLSEGDEPFRKVVIKPRL
jgi:spoIIIJ-associated protein